MNLLLGVLGLPLGSVLIASAVTARSSLPLDNLIVGIASVVTGIAALATGLRGVRAWQHGTPMPVAWYWPGLAAGVLQGTAFAGGIAMSFFLGAGSLVGVPAWMIALMMLGLGGAPYLGALCCAGAWWVERERPDGLPMPELR